MEDFVTRSQHWRRKLVLSCDFFLFIAEEKKIPMCLYSNRHTSMYSTKTSIVIFQCARRIYILYFSSSKNKIAKAECRLCKNVTDSSTCSNKNNYAEKTLVTLVDCIM